MAKSQSSAPKHVGLWLALLLLAGGGLRVYRLDAQSTWLDEMWRVVWAKGYEVDRPFGFLPSETAARLPSRDLKHALPVVNAHNPPLNSILLNTWMRAVGADSDYALRLPLALLGALSILGMFLAARQVLGAGVGLWAAALVAFSPYHVFYAQELNHYALAACLVAFSMWFYFRWLERPSIAAGLGLVATGLGALYTHYFAAIVLLFQAAALLVRYRNPRALALAASPFFAIAAGFAPYLPTVRRQLAEMTNTGQIDLFRGAQYFRDGMLAILVQPWLGDRGLTLAPLVGVPIALVGVSLFILGIRSQEDRSRRLVLLINGAGPLVLVALLYWGTKWNSILWPRYQLFFTFAEFIPIAAAMQHARRSRWLAAPALAALAVIGFRFMFTELVKEDWKQVARTIAARGSHEENIVVHRALLTYSLGRYLEPDHRLFGVESTADWPRRVAVAVNGASAIWFVSACAESGAFPAAVHAFLSCRFARREDLPVRPGRSGMTVARYSEPRFAGQAVRGAASSACRDAFDGEAVAAWERASTGPVVEGGVIDAPTGLEIHADVRTLTVTGWAFSTRGIQKLVFDLDGKPAHQARHVGLYRADVAAAYREVPAIYSQHAEFWSVLDLSSVGSGVHSLSVTAVHDDGSTNTIGPSKFILQRSENMGGGHRSGEAATTRSLP